MNVASAVIVGVLFVLAGLAVWRNIRKGAPCPCGDCCGCGRVGKCRERGRNENHASHEKSDLLN